MMTKVPEPTQGRPLVSVIIPFFNVEAFIGEAVQSVLDQTYDHWELLLVDDGSSDGSREIAEGFVRDHPDRVRCIEHPGRINKGLSETRNLGWRAAQGELVAFLDADDLWLPDKLSKQVSIFELFPQVELCVGASLYWHQWAGSKSSARVDEKMVAGGPPEKVLEPRELVTDLYPLGSGHAPSMNTVVVRRDMDRKTGMFEPCFRRSFEDQAFLIKCYLFCTIYILPDVLDKYRQGRADSITQVELRSDQRHDLNIEFYTWLARYLKSLGPLAEGLAARARLLRNERRRKKWRDKLRKVLRRLRFHDG